jgi:hypothetical protein
MERAQEAIKAQARLWLLGAVSLMVLLVAGVPCARASVFPAAFVGQYECAESRCVRSFVNVVGDIAEKILITSIPAIERIFEINPRFAPAYLEGQFVSLSSLVTGGGLSTGDIRAKFAMQLFQKSWGMAIVVDPDASARPKGCWDRPSRYGLDVDIGCANGDISPIQDFRSLFRIASLLKRSVSGAPTGICRSAGNSFCADKKISLKAEVTNSRPVNTARTSV